MDYLGWNRLDPEDYVAKKKKVGPGKELDWNTVKTHPLFGDKAVRRALAKAVNLDNIIKTLLTSKKTGQTYGKPSVSTVTPTLCEAHNNDIKPIAFDVAAAKAELAAAGWKDTNDDGVLDKGGKPFKFTLLTNAGNTRRAKSAVIIQANLKAVGVQMEIRQLESNTFFERLRKKDYDAALAGWSAGLFVDPTNLWHSGDRYEFNFTAYSNPKVDTLIEKAMREPDPDKGNAMIKEIQAMIYEDQPYLFLFWLDGVVALHERFKDAKIDVLSSQGDLYSWWVPGGQVKYAR